MSPGEALVPTPSHQEDDDDKSSRELEPAIGRLRGAILLTARRIRQEGTVGEITPSQYEVLRALKSGPKTARRLADQEQVRPPWMTKTINALAERGLVTRSDDPNDGRQQLVALTDTGWKTLDETVRRRSEWLAGRVDSLTREQRETLFEAAEILHSIRES
jgi:DNA-binding MarR family transcriptional regulator